MNPSSNEELVLALEAAATAGKYNEPTRVFALSLVAQWKSKHKLTDKQWYWVKKLVDDLTKPKPEPMVVDVGTFTGVFGLFDQARQHLKYPKISLEVNHQPVVLAYCGPQSKHPNTVNITDGGPWGNSTWYGRVDQQGHWTVNLKADKTMLADIEEFLIRFSAQPARAAREYGRLTGRCCFCNKKLTDERSTAAGFGESCSKVYGLHAQWKAATAVLEAA